MDKPNRLLNKTAPGSASAYPDKKHLWYRELFVLFYLGMFAASFLNRPFPDSRAVSLLIKGAELLYAPGMIFAAGCLMGAQDASRKDFRKNTLRKALYSILLFYTVCCSVFVFILYLLPRYPAVPARGQAPPPPSQSPAHPPYFLKCRARSPLLSVRGAHRCPAATPPPLPE